MSEGLSASLRRFQELCDRRGERHFACRGSLFRVFSGVARPIGPVTQGHALSDAEAREVMRALGARVVMWTDGCDESKQTDWYAVICKSFTPLEEMNSDRRRGIRRGLQNCVVRRLDADFVASHGYEVYVKAYERYKGGATPLWDEDGFRAYFAASRDFPDITHYWGAFHRDRLIALVANNVYDKTEVTYWMIKLHPEFLALNAGSALIHVMNQYYLADQGYAYVNDGWRTLVHQTAIQDFLIRKFGFFRICTNLTARYRPPLGWFVRATFPLRQRLGRLHPHLAALYALEEAARKRG